MMGCITFIHVYDTRFYIWWVVLHTYIWYKVLYLMGCIAYIYDTRFCIWWVVLHTYVTSSYIWCITYIYDTRFYIWWVVLHTYMYMIQGFISDGLYYIHIWYKVLYLMGCITYIYDTRFYIWWVVLHTYMIQGFMCIQPIRYKTLYHICM
jgi:hypothetical protein